MNPVQAMIIAGETSGDAIASELILAMRPLPEAGSWQWFGAGGPRMHAAGVEVLHDLTAISVIGPADVARRYFKFRTLFNHLLSEACARQPRVVVLVDFSHFNHRFARAVRRRAAGMGGKWNPRIIKYVSPQVWASRPGRANDMARDLDLLLCIFPFEPAWYARRVPSLDVRYVGHPVIDRYHGTDPRPSPPISGLNAAMLPGSREQELRRHLPVMVDAALQISRAHPCQWVLVVPDERMKQLALGIVASRLQVRVQVGGVAAVLRSVSLALASTGSVTMECAYFGVPTVALYRTSWLTYQIGKRLVTVRHLAMPNLLADSLVMPEFVQHEATAERIAEAAIAILANPAMRSSMQEQMGRVIGSLGPPGASLRAARAILECIKA